MLQPNATLYIKNIDWKIKKGLLRRALYSLFTRHGKVLEIIILRRDGLRGQAWVIFDDVQSATAAMQAEQGFTFFGKDLVLEYAREKSDRVAKRDGTYVPKAKRQKKAVKQERENAPSTEQGTSEENKGENEKPQDEQQQTPLTEAGGTSQDTEPPSKYLLAQDLPAECNEMMLGMLFRQYEGYKEVRMPRAGLAFVEFEDEPHATLAKQALDGFKLTASDILRLTYGKA